MYDKRSVSCFKCCIVQYIKHACKIVYSCCTVRLRTFGISICPCYEVYVYNSKT